MKLYVATYLLLMGLLAATVGVAYVPLGPVLNNVAALGIAVVKALLVLVFFMHFRRTQQLVFLYWALAGAAVLIGTAFTFADYLLR